MAPRSQERLKGTAVGSPRLLRAQRQAFILPASSWATQHIINPSWAGWDKVLVQIAPSHIIWSISDTWNSINPKNIQGKSAISTMLNEGSEKELMFLHHLGSRFSSKAKYKQTKTPVLRIYHQPTRKSLLIRLPISNSWHLLCFLTFPV